MANLRKIKKEINNLTNEVISDCFLYLEMNKEKNKKEVMGIMKDTIKTRNDLIYKVNHPGSGDRKKIKKHFQKIKNELVDKMDAHFLKLSKIARGAKKDEKKKSTKK